MPQAIRVDSSFSTAHDTARILGVSKSRTEALIKIAKGYTERILSRRHSKSDATPGKVHRKRKSASTVESARKSSGRDADTKTPALKSKKTKAKR